MRTSDIYYQDRSLFFPTYGNYFCHLWITCTWIAHESVAH